MIQANLASSSSTLENLFSTEVLRWRYFRALTVSFFMQQIVSSMVCFAIKTICFDYIWNPLVWADIILNTLLFPTWIFRILLPLCCYIIIARIHVHCYSVKWWIPGRRMEYFSQFFQVKKFIYSLIFVCVSSTLLQYYAYLIDPQLNVLVIECSDSSVVEGSVCINHQAVLVYIFGFVFGWRVAFKYFLHNYNSLHPPVAQPNAFIRFKSKLKLRIVLEACFFYDVTWGSLASVYILHLLLSASGVFQQWISNFAGVNHLEDTTLFWSIPPPLFDARFILTLGSCSILLAYNLHCFFLTFQEIVMQRIQLPLGGEELPSYGSQAQISSVWTLSNSLVSSCELLQLLAFRHLRDLATLQNTWGNACRAQIFTISKPGGHPRNWQGVVNPSLNLIRKFTDRLKQQSSVEEKLLSEKSSIESLHRQTDVNKNQLGGKTSGFVIKEKWAQVKDRALHLPFVWYLLSDLPDSKNRQIFAECQAVIWAVQGLSNLAAASYTDDQFGVVQKNIADILTALVEMQLTVENVGRGLPSRRVAQGTSLGSRMQKHPRDLQLRRSLLITLKTSLYIITNTFKETIREINISGEVKNKLDSYLAFQEG